MTAPTPHAVLVEKVAAVFPETLHGETREQLARAAIAAVREALVEPDAAMLLFGFNALRTDNVLDSSEQGRVRRIYRAMLAASPLAEDGDADSRPR